MRSIELIGLTLLVLGLVILFLLRDTLIRLIIFFLEFLGVILGILLVITGLGMVLGGRWVSRRRYQNY